MPDVPDRRPVLDKFPEVQAVEADLITYEALLRRWQARINLVGPSTLPDLWRRHFADSIQLLSYASQASTWIDLGSGAGFPGMVIALALKGRADSIVHLVESDTRKAAFLREVSRETQARAIIHAARIEEVAPTLPQPDVVTSRALAPLPTLVALTRPWLLKGATGLFLVGQSQKAELTALDDDPTLRVARSPSRTSDGLVVSVSCS